MVGGPRSRKINQDKKRKEDKATRWWGRGGGRRPGGSGWFQGEQVNRRGTKGVGWSHLPSASVPTPSINISGLVFSGVFQELIPTI